MVSILDAELKLRFPKGDVFLLGWCDTKGLSRVCACSLLVSQPRAVSGPELSAREQRGCSASAAQIVSN